MTLDQLKQEFIGDRLHGAMREQRLVEDDLVANALIDVGELVGCPAESVLYESGSICRGIYFVLHGRIELLRGGNRLAQLDAGQQTGSWPILYSDPTYKVSARAIEDSVLWRVGTQDFEEVGNRFPSIWKSLARSQSDRVKRMNEVFLPANSTPRLLIGSATESLPSARSLLADIRKQGGIEVQLWTDVFPPGQSNLESLTLGLDDWDFAAFFFTPDDHVTCRGVEAHAPRDNVIFEAGMCIGRLGRLRTFVLIPTAPKIKMPSDLKGIGKLRYVENPVEVLDTLLALATRLGPRTRVAIDKLSAGPGG